MPPLYGGAGPGEAGGREGEQVDSGDGKLLCLINPSLPQGVTRPPPPPPPDAWVVRKRTHAWAGVEPQGLAPEQNPQPAQEASGLRMAVRP